MRLFALAILLAALPCFASAAALVDINTADAALLDTLPGIGPAKAAAIVGYRTLNGPFAAIEDIQKVSGIGPATFANIEALITVGAAPSAGVPAPASTTPASPSGSASLYVPPPSALSLDIGGDRPASLNVPLALAATVKAKGGADDPSAVVSWSFGDGSSASGRVVSKTYGYPGAYVVEASVADGETAARASIIVTAALAAVRIISVDGEGIMLANSGDARLDLSGWRLVTDLGTFRFPSGTVLLPDTKVLIPWSVTDLPVSLALTLAYPDGASAARYPEPLAVALPEASSTPAAPVEEAAQPPARAAGLSSVQTPSYPVEYGEAPPAVSSVADMSHAAAAPTAGADASPGAPIAADATNAALSAAAAPAAGLLHSKWALSLLGILALAGGAFMIL